jgi:hypothetical protein
MMMQNESLSFYLDLQTGAVFPQASDGELDDDEELEEYAKLMEADPERFAELPSGFDINEWRMMERFALEVKDQRVSDSLLSAIRGKGAFGRFRSCVDVAGLLEEWYRFKDGAYREVAMDWCRHNNVTYVEDKPR